MDRRKHTKRIQKRSTNKRLLRFRKRRPFPWKNLQKSVLAFLIISKRISKRRNFLRKTNSLRRIHKIAKKKTIAKKYASLVHCSTKRVLRDFQLLKPILRQEQIQKKLKMSDEEIAFIQK